jgi:hypothetical protein
MGDETLLAADPNFEQFSRNQLRVAEDVVRNSAIRACVDMAERYDADIEGCDADELIRYGEAIDCCFRLAYIIKYGTFPPAGDAWSVEFCEMLREIRAEVHKKSV